MSPAAVAVLSAVVGGLLGAGVPWLLARVPEPVPAPGPVEAEVAPGPPATYASISAARWLGPLAVALSAAGAGAVAVATGPDPVLVGLVPLLPVGVLLGVVDARRRLLPRVVVLPATGAALVLLGAEWALVGDTGVALRALVAMLLARSLFWLLWYLRPSGMGFGDVRLAALLGLVLGRLGWGAWALGLYAGLVLFAVHAVGLALWRRDRAVLRTALPYGPFMLAGALVGVLGAGAVTLGG